MKKSARTAIVVIVIIAVTFGLLALGGLFTRRTENVSTTKFFELAGIEYEDVVNEQGKATKKVIAYNPDKAVIKKIVISTFTITGYDAVTNGKAIYESSYYPYDLIKP